jgi:uncharacterized protein (TIGR03437 family)
MDWGIMNRTKRLLLLVLLAGVGAWAQSISAVKISTNPSGPNFAVDGQVYNSPQVFTWPTGSKHIVEFLVAIDPITRAPLPYQTSVGDNTRYYFGAWTDNSALLGPGSSPVQTVTASPALTSLTATVNVQYRVHINFDNGNGIGNTACLGAPGNPPKKGLFPGVVYFDNQCVGDIADFYVTAGVHALNAFPYPGFVFLGWVINGGPNTYMITYNVTTPIQITPLWEPAKRVEFLTNPPGLSVLVDRTPIPTSGNPQYPPTPGSYGANCTTASYLPPLASAGFTPLCAGDFDFVPGSKHAVGAPSPQADKLGYLWVFTGFANGLKQNDTYVVDTNTSAADTMVANFVPGVRVSVLTNPGGLKVQVDGDNSTIPPYTFVWGEGETHHLAAPAQQADSSGRQWVFSGWSNKGSATQDVTVPSGVNGFAVTATYARLGQVRVTSNPIGLTLTVDGSPCLTPCTVDRPSGTQIQVTAPQSLTLSQVSRYDFASWSDGTATASDTITFNQNVQNLSASFHASFVLLTQSNPPGNATFTLTPASPDGFYPDGTQVSVTVTPNEGFTFRRWEGDLFGTLNSGAVTMNSPHSIVAALDPIPLARKAKVQTAAGATPDGAIAPGSLISIFGDNLAPAFQLGPANPLAQAIGDITVTIGNSILPLVYVSPEQINAQVPSGLKDGDYALTIHWLGQPDVTGTLTVARDAPALFQNSNDQNLPLAFATHQDGSAVTFSSPARRDETVSIYGTGFGPYDRTLPDGFLPSSTDKYVTADPVAINLGGVAIQPEFAGASTVMPGIQIVRFKITSDIPSGATLDLIATVGGKDSAKVTLPVQ